MVTGDFNAGENNPVIRFLKGQSARRADSTVVSPRLIDTFRVLHPNADSVGAFHAFSGDVSGEKIDYIFVQNRTRVLTAEIVHYQKDGRFPSDHFPVVAKILLPCLAR